MAQIQYIKYLYENQEKSLREIAKMTGTSFQTVQKYAYMENWSPNKLPNMEPAKYKVLGPYIPIIDRWMEADRKMPRKQRHTAKRVYERLVEEEGYVGSYSSVKKYYRKKKYLLGLGNKTEGYIPLVHPAGCAQLDFGDIVYDDGTGIQHEGYEMILSFPHSNKAYAQVLPSQKRECLFEGMKRIFNHMGGVPTVIRFDNMTTAVTGIHSGHERELTEEFIRFALHYRFQYEFCNPSSGNEKGNVESNVGYIRRNLFVPIPVITDMDVYNRELLNRCEKLGEREHYREEGTINTLWEDDRKELLVLPKYDYEVFQYEIATVNKVGMIQLDTNRYSVSPELSGQKVQIKAYYDRLEIYHDGNRIVTHKRCYGKNREILDWTKYVSLLTKKTYATLSSKVFTQMPENWQEHLKSCTLTERRNALLVLRDIVNSGNAERCGEILELATKSGRCDHDSIRQCYYSLTGQKLPPKPLFFENEAHRKLPPPDLSVYNTLTGGGEQNER